MPLKARLQGWHERYGNSTSRCKRSIGACQVLAQGSNLHRKALRHPLKKLVRC